MMRFIGKKPIGLRIPLAALLMLAAAVALATGLATPGAAAAQGSSTTYVTTGNKTPCGPGAAAAPANPIAVINSGHFAMFDVYWDNTDEPTSGKTLNNNLCPPAMSTSTTMNEEEEITGKTFTRAASNTDIRETLFHIPTGNEVTLAAATVDDGTDDEGNPYPTTFGADKYRFLGETGDRVWIVSSHDEEHLNPGFSTALLPDDFLAEGDEVQFELEAVRVPGESVDDRGTAFAFKNADGDNDTADEVLWRSDAPHGLIGLEVGSNIKRYRHLHWAFTKPGIYQMQVHARALPTTAYFEDNETVTSEVRRYTFQVGELADLGITVSPDDHRPATGGNVVITYTASNDGPDAAAAVKVSAPLPTGLAYVSAATAAGSYASATGEWTVGSLASDATATLSLTATVGSGAAGDTLTPTAYIRDTGDNPDLDALTGNNRATATLRPGAPANSAPQFRIVRAIAENVSRDTPAGAPVMAIDDDGDGLTYSLSGAHAARFTVDSQGQIATSGCGVMDYEAHSVYPLTLSVRDSKNSAGEADTANDASIGVTIKVTDTVDEPSDPNPFTLALQSDRTNLTVNQTVTLTAIPDRAPGCSLDYYWEELIDGSTWRHASAFDGHSTATFTHNTVGPRQYKVKINRVRDSQGNPVPDYKLGSISAVSPWISWGAAGQ